MMPVMEFIGDLERAFATALYPNRYAIAGVLVLAAAIVGYVAWRRRWDLAARRRPRRALGIVAVAAVVGIPLAWYLGSPLFLTSTVDEPAPVTAEVAPSPAVEPSAAAPSASPSASAPSGPPTFSPEATRGAERRGSFTGADEFHFGRGVARLIETSPGTFTVRLEEFAVRNGPDLYVYLSPSAEGYAKGAVELGRLKADRGNQNYRVPDGTNVATARSVVIWCKQFGVLFATAPLA